MDIQFFANPNHVPKPPSEVVIESLKVTPYPDRFRIYIEIKVTPFQERPNLFLVLRRSDGQQVGELSIIATMHNQMEFTMHVRGVDDPAGEYTMDAELFYETRQPPQDQQQITFSIPEAEA